MWAETAGGDPPLVERIRVCPSCNRVATERLSPRSGSYEKPHEIEVIRTPARARFPRLGIRASRAVADGCSQVPPRAAQRRLDGDLFQVRGLRIAGQRSR